MNANYDINADINAPAPAPAPYVCLYAANGFSLFLLDLPAGADDADRLLTLVRLDSAVGDSISDRAIRYADWVWGTDLNRGYQLVKDGGGIDLAAVAALVTDLLFNGDLKRSDLHWSNVKDLMALLLGMAKA